MNRLLDSFADTTTTNGCPAFSSTHNALLDLFGVAGTARNISDADLCRMADKAADENLLYTFKLLFLIRDCRGGYGERRAFRVILRHFAQRLDIDRLIPFIPEYGRFDDLFILFGTPAEKAMLDFIATVLVCDLWTKQIHVDFSNTDIMEKVALIESAHCLPSAQVRGHITLLAKWLPSINASSKATIDYANKIRKHLGVNAKTYRKMLSMLRAELDIVENHVRESDFAGIDYSAVPSLALLKYRKVFKKKSPEYAEFLEKVKSGEKKINTSVATPFDIVHKIRQILTGDCMGSEFTGTVHNWATLNEHGYVTGVKPELKDDTLILAWKNLKDYVGGNKSALVVCDVSGSMFDDMNSIDVALSLTLYLAERNTGDWQDRFFTFDSNSHLVTLQGADIFDKVANLGSTAWGGSTNVVSAFTSLLEHAVANNIPQDEMPEQVIIVSDMQFDNACQHPTESMMFNIKRMYSSHGYTVPQLVFWNANARAGNQPVTQDATGTILVSGYSAAMFKFILNSDHDATPLAFMMSVLESKRYEPIQ